MILFTCMALNTNQKLTRSYFPFYRPWFVNLGTFNILERIIFCCDGLFCASQDVEQHLSGLYTPDARSSLPTFSTEYQNVSRYCKYTLEAWASVMQLAEDLYSKMEIHIFNPYLRIVQSHRYFKFHMLKFKFIISTFPHNYCWKSSYFECPPFHQVSSQSTRSLMP